MFKCSKKKKEKKTYIKELLIENEGLAKNNQLLAEDNRDKTEKLQKGETQNKKLEDKIKNLEKKVSELEAQSVITNASYESEKSLVNILKGNLLTYEEKYKNVNHEVEALKDEIKSLEEIPKQIKNLLINLTLYQDFEEKQISATKEIYYLADKKSKSHDDLSDLEINSNKHRQNRSVQCISKSLTELRMEEGELQSQILNTESSNTQLFMLYEQLYNTVLQVSEVLDNNSNGKEVLFASRKQENTKLMEAEQTEVKCAELIEKRFSIKNKILKIPVQQPDDILDPHITKSLDIIEDIRKDTVNLQREIENFVGTKEDKDYLHLNELLVRNIMKLDNIDSEGQHIIRKKRKDVIQFIQRLHRILNDKV